jgi:hypothetical protein
LLLNGAVKMEAQEKSLFRALSLLARADNRG